MNLPFESSGGFHVQKNMFSAFRKLMVEIRASVRECVALPCDLDSWCGLETHTQVLSPPSTKMIPGHGKEGDSATKPGQTRNKGLVMIEWRVFKPRKLRTREADPRLFQLFSRPCAETHSWLWERLGVGHGKGPRILRAAHISDFWAVLCLVAGCFSIRIYFKNTLYHFSFNIQMPPGSTISIKYITHTCIFPSLHYS